MSQPRFHARGVAPAPGTFFPAVGSASSLYIHFRQQRDHAMLMITDRPLPARAVFFRGFTAFSSGDSSASLGLGVRTGIGGGSGTADLDLWEELATDLVDLCVSASASRWSCCSRLARSNVACSYVLSQYAWVFLASGSLFQN